MWCSVEHILSRRSSSKIITPSFHEQYFSVSIALSTWGMPLCMARWSPGFKEILSNGVSTSTFPSTRVTEALGSYAFTLNWVPVAVTERYVVETLKGCALSDWTSKYASPFRITSLVSSLNFAGYWMVLFALSHTSVPSGSVAWLVHP